MPRVLHRRERCGALRGRVSCPHARHPETLRNLAKPTLIVLRKPGQARSATEHARPGRSAPGNCRPASGPLERRLARMSVGAAIAIGALVGLALGILVSVTTDVPLAPEIGLVLGALVGWLSRRRV